MKVKGICREIVERMVQRTRELSQGRNVGSIGFVDEEGYLSSMTEPVDGGLGGIPFRSLLGRVADMGEKSIVEGLTQLPDNAVFITTRPGKTGLITDVSAVDFFGIPIICIGVKAEGAAGVGIVYPKSEYFDLATEAEKLNLATLETKTMEAEKNVLRRSHQLELRYLEVGEELPVVDRKILPLEHRRGQTEKMPRMDIHGIDAKMAEALVGRSIEIGQGREVAAVGLVDDNGRVSPWGHIVAGGIGFVPARLMASSALDIDGKSLRSIYSEYMDPRAVIVHTHPGGTGVMHIGDASAGPGSWGRPIIAIGHDKDGEIKGATVLEPTASLFKLADEEEKLNLQFFSADTPEEEANIRNRKFGIAQDYTRLCKTIEIN
ncbi:MAG: peptidase S7 [Bacillota bacterium]